MSDLSIPTLPHVNTNPAPQGMIAGPLGAFAPDISMTPGITHSDDALGRYHNDINERNKKIADYLIAREAGASATELQHLIDDILHADHEAQDIFDHQMTEQQKAKAKAEDQATGQSITPATDPNDQKDVLDDINALPGAVPTAKGEKPESPDTLIGPSRTLSMSSHKFMTPGQEFMLFLSMITSAVRFFANSPFFFEFSGNQRGQASAARNDAAALMARGATEGQAMSSTFRNFYNSDQADDSDRMYMMARRAGSSDHAATERAVQYAQREAAARLQHGASAYEQQGLSHDQAYIHAFEDESVNPIYRDEFEQLVQQNRSRGQSAEQACHDTIARLSELHGDASHITRTSSLPRQSEDTVRERFLAALAHGQSAYDAEQSVLQSLGSIDAATRRAVEAYMRHVRTAVSDAANGERNNEFGRSIPRLAPSVRRMLEESYNLGISRGLTPERARQFALFYLKSMGLTGNNRIAVMRLFLESLGPPPSSSGGSDGDLRH